MEEKKFQQKKTKKLHWINVTIFNIASNCYDQEDKTVILYKLRLRDFYRPDIKKKKKKYEKSASECRKINFCYQ